MIFKTERVVKERKKHVYDERHIWIETSIYFFGILIFRMKKISSYK